MKKTARFITLLTALLLLASTANAMGLLSIARGLAYLGDWEAAYIDAGDGVPRDKYLGMNPADAMAFTITADSAFVLRVQGQQAAGTWEEIEGGIRSDMNGEISDLKLEGDYLVLRDGLMVIYFRRAGTTPPPPQGAAPMTQAPVTGDPTQGGPVGGFAGKWIPRRYEMSGYVFDITMLFGDAGGIRLNPDGTAFASITADYDEPFTWSQDSNGLKISGSFNFQSPEWDAQKQELSFAYASPDIRVIYTKEAGDAPPQPTATPAVIQTATPLAPTDAPETPSPSPVIDPPGPTFTPQPPAAGGVQIENAFFTASFPEGWKENTGWSSQWDGYVSVVVEKPGAGGWAEGSVSMQASVEDVDSYRDKARQLNEYAQKAGQEKAGETTIGGIPFVTAEYESWGSKAIGFATRAEAQGVTLYITVEQADRIADDLPGILASIAYTLPTPATPNVDPPLPEDGRRYEPQTGTAAIGDKQVTAQWLKSDESIIVDDIFSVHAALAGDTLFTISGKSLGAFSTGDGTLTAKDGGLRLEDEYEQLSAGKDGIVYVAQGFYNILAVKDGAILEDNSVGGHLAMHPDGEWGIGFWANADTKRIEAKDGKLSEQPWILIGMSDPAARKGRFSSVNTVHIAKDRIYAAGSDAQSGDAQRVAAYDLQGNELFTFGAADWMQDDAFGSVTAIAETPSGIAVLDGNYRALKLFSLSGEYLGQVEDLDALLGTDYPWPFAMGALPDGSLFIAVAQERADDSADEMLVFRVTGL